MFGAIRIMHFFSLSLLKWMAQLNCIFASFFFFFKLNGFLISLSNLILFFSFLWKVITQFLLFYVWYDANICYHHHHIYLFFLSIFIDLWFGLKKSRIFIEHSKNIQAAHTSHYFWLIRKLVQCLFFFCSFILHTWYNSDTNKLSPGLCYYKRIFFLLFAKKKNWKIANGNGILERVRQGHTFFF